MNNDQRGKYQMRYREILESKSDVHFTIHARGYHHGQHDLTLTADDAAGNRLGYIEYSVFRGVPKVQMIEVAPEHRGQGYGPRLLRRLQAEFPDEEIDLGMLTPDGMKMLGKMATRFEPTPGYAVKAQRLHAIEQQLAHYSQLADQFQTSDHSSQARTALHASTADWNDLHDEFIKLKLELEHLRPGKRLFSTGT